MRQVGFLLVIGVIATTSVATAKIWHVPSECPTIQSGIDSAAAGDTVLVADGTYTGDGNRDIDFYGKEILVMSEKGPNNCIIDCDGYHHRGFYFHSGEDSTSIVKGFTIRKGWVVAGGGGGIYCHYSSPTIIGNSIRDNDVTSQEGGGGIKCEYSSPNIFENTVTDNRANVGGGIICDSYSSPRIENNTISENLVRYFAAGIYCIGFSSPTISGNTISRNIAEGDGGGIYCKDQSCPKITGNAISSNIAYVEGGGSGGGIFCDYSSPTITGNTISGNAAYACGGGICSYESSPLIEGNTITGNEAGGGAGIFYEGYSTSTIEGNTIKENIAQSYGGGINCNYITDLKIIGNKITENVSNWCAGGISCWHTCSPTIEGNLIVGNSSTEDGGGVFLDYKSSPTIVGNTITENSANRGGGIICLRSSSSTVLNSILWADNANEGSEIFLDESSTITVDYSDIMGGWTGTGNISLDPRFLLPAKRDYRLLWGSPCIDAGHPDSLDPDETRSDMGAYPFDQSHPLTIYLTPDTTLIVRPGELGVTYTLINIEPNPWTFWLRSDVTLPNGKPYPGNPIIGPMKLTLQSEQSKQQHIMHSVPGKAPLGIYTYKSRIGLPPDQLIDEDSFEFEVVE